MQEISIWKVDSLKRLIRRVDDDETNHESNIFKVEPRERNSIIESKTIVANTGSVSNPAEGIAYNLINDGLNVYNTTGGSIYTQSLLESEKNVVEESRKVSSTDLGEAGNPDLICFKHFEDREPDFFFIEVKRNSDTLSQNQLRWINKNKWAEVYVLRLVEAENLDSNQFLSPEDLIQTEGVERNPEKMLKK